MTTLREYCEEVARIGRLLLKDVDDHDLNAVQRAELHKRLDTLAYCIREHDRIQSPPWR